MIGWLRDLKRLISDGSCSKRRYEALEGELAQRKYFEDRKRDMSARHPEAEEVYLTLEESLAICDVLQSGRWFQYGEFEYHIESDDLAGRAWRRPAQPSNQSNEPVTNGW